ncbi:hypothetical protein ACFQ07_03400, partial [Actinomadura adrarensis]
MSALPVEGNSVKGADMRGEPTTQETGATTGPAGRPAGKGTGKTAKAGKGKGGKDAARPASKRTG